MVVQRSVVGDDKIGVATQLVAEPILGKDGGGGVLEPLVVRSKLFDEVVHLILQAVVLSFPFFQVFRTSC